MLKKSLILVFIILCLDQVLKIWIKTHMTLGQELVIAHNWFILHFTENNGMAYGIQFSGNYGKLFLSLFRIAAVGLLSWYIYKLTRRETHFGVIFSFSLILAGAIGNILDSAFYGLIFTESTFFDVAKLVPPGSGYASFLHGKVVDMLYFPIIEGQYPKWVPWLGGQMFAFFRPVFNLSDASITSGVIYLLVFQRSFFKNGGEGAPDEPETGVSGTDGPETGPSGPADQHL